MYWSLKLESKAPDNISLVDLGLSHLEACTVRSSMGYCWHVHPCRLFSPSSRCLLVPASFVVITTGTCRLSRPVLPQLTLLGSDSILCCITSGTCRLSRPILPHLTLLVTDSILCCIRTGTCRLSWPLLCCLFITTPFTIMTASTQNICRLHLLSFVLHACDCTNIKF